ncbi:MAG: alpha/beta fold hydrolase [Steroidobacteraceae bacterium]|jgi:4,5:9,10-diseco-3-hydroxy-5,9,17-trioxoandrosta-1(10),2-diene-4-oate hydrolase
MGALSLGEPVVTGGPPSGRSLRLPSGYELHFHDTGEVANGRTIVMLQGSGPGANGWSNFRHNIEALHAAGHRVIVPDLIGFGYSSKPTGLDYTLDLFVTTTLELLDALKVDRCVLVGNSLGGAVAIGICLARVGMVEKLVVMGCGGIESTETYFAMPGIQKMVSGFVGGEINPKWLRGILQMLSFDPVHVTDDLVAERFAILQLMPKDVLGRMRIPDLTPRLPELTMPILGFWGVEDQFCPASGALKITAQCPHSQMIIYSQVGHWVMIERSHEFNRHVIDFLAA